MAPLGQQKLLGHACHVLGFGRLHDHAADQVTAGDMRLAPESERVQLLGDAAERGDGDPLQQTRVVRGQHLQLAAERICQGLGEGGEQHFASRFSRSMRITRWSATTVLPVPAEPATRAGPVQYEISEEMKLYK
jgi:hypothetical protein